jgi:antitoxin HigA-1
MRAVDILKMERPPTHPGEMLLEEFLKPRGISQSDFAKHIDVSFPRLNDLIHARRGVTVDTALKLAAALGTSPELWLNLQQAWDLWQAVHGDPRNVFQFPDPLPITFHSDDGRVYRINPPSWEGTSGWVLEDEDGNDVAELPDVDGDTPSIDAIRRAILAANQPRKTSRKRQAP